jgi:hypothetical protein
MRLLVAAIAFALLLGPLPSARGHGMMTKPRPRNWISYINQQSYCPHCANANGGCGVQGN